MTDLAETIRILDRLVAFPSIASNGNLALIEWVAERLDDAGARVEILPSEDEGKANLFATIGPEVADGVVLSGHTDVVPTECQPWSSDPFRMEERDGRLYGRGTADMKGFVAACLAMAPRFAALPLVRPIHFSFTCDEETTCFGARDVVRALSARANRPSRVIVGEPTNMAIIEGHKGAHEYLTRITGLAGHGSEPARGVNAVEFAVRYVAKLMEVRDALANRATPESRFKPPYSTVNVGMLNGGIVANVIPDQAIVEWETRPVRAEDFTFVKDTMAAYARDVLLPEMQAVSPKADIVTEVIGEVEGLEPTQDNPARDLVIELTGANATGVVAFGTEAGFFQSIGLSVVVCGPGAIEQAHKANEYIETSELLACLTMLERLGERLCR